MNMLAYGLHAVSGTAKTTMLVTSPVSKKSYLFYKDTFYILKKSRIGRTITENWKKFDEKSEVAPFTLWDTEGEIHVKADAKRFEIKNKSYYVDIKPHKQKFWKGWRTDTKVDYNNLKLVGSDLAKSSHTKLGDISIVQHFVESGKKLTVIGEVQSGVNGPTIDTSKWYSTITDMDFHDLKKKFAIYASINLLGVFISLATIATFIF